MVTSFGTIGTGGTYGFGASTTTTGAGAGAGYAAYGTNGLALVFGVKEPALTLNFGAGTTAGLVAALVKITGLFIFLAWYSYP